MRVRTFLRRIFLTTRWIFPDLSHTIKRIIRFFHGQTNRKRDALFIHDICVCISYIRVYLPTRIILFDSKTFTHEISWVRSTPVTTIIRRRMRSQTDHSYILYLLRARARVFVCTCVHVWDTSLSFCPRVIIYFVFTSTCTRVSRSYAG